jgi:deoxyhypusine synthase
MKADRQLIRDLRASLSETARANTDLAIRKIAEAKSKNGSVVVVTGSGPNLHEGVTTLIAELIRKEIVDGVITSSAVVAHEMAGTLDRVKRIHIAAAEEIGLPLALLPRGRVFEITVLSHAAHAELRKEFSTGWDLYDRLEQAPGDVIIKAAGNMAWPMGWRTERLAREAQEVAKQLGTTLEHAAGLGADPMTMIGAAALRGVPVVVSIPQLVGGGAVGLAIGDTISISRRARLVAELLQRADVIVESAIALSQEIHDGPFETYTGHGIWTAWDGLPTYSLEGKTLVRIDLDPNLETAWRLERQNSEVQKAVDLGLPKTKQAGIPFRMEMSGFARLEGSIPLTTDVGVAWPIIAGGLEEKLGVDLDFIPAPQETAEGKRVREWIVENVAYVNRRQMFEAAASILSRSCAAKPRPATAHEPALQMVCGGNAVVDRLL